jgi:acid phosphatase type 7
VTKRTDHPRSIACVTFVLWCSASAALGANDARPIGVILAAGDITGCGKAEIAQATATAAVLGREIDQLRKDGIPLKVMILGDLAYNRGSKKEFKCFDQTWGKVLRAKLADPSVDILPISGNHEYRTWGAKGFFKYFADNAWIKGGKGGYYQLTFPAGHEAAWNLIGLNSEREDFTPQTSWLAGELKAATQTCILGFWHRPVFSSGFHGHGRDGLFTLPGSAPRKQDFLAKEEAMIAEAGGSLVLNGHDHNYEELAPHDALGAPSATGLRSFIVGTGGRTLRDYDGTKWTGISANFDHTSYGILRLDLFPGSYTWNFLTTDGSVKYKGQGNCNKAAIQ